MKDKTITIRVSLELEEALRRLHAAERKKAEVALNSEELTFSKFIRDLMIEAATKKVKK